MQCKVGDKVKVKGLEYEIAEIFYQDYLGNCETC